MSFSLLATLGYTFYFEKTLGGSGMKQKIDKITGKEEKRFYLQYTFPPSCVGETGRVGMPGRREVGHGNLAER